MPCTAAPLVMIRNPSTEVKTLNATAETIETTQPQPTEAPLTLALLKEKMPGYLDVPIEGFGTFRLHRLGSLSLLRQQLTVSEIVDEDGTAPEDEMIRRMMDFVARSLGSDFDTEEGRTYLLALPPDVQTKLIGSASSFHMLKIAKQSELITEAKNE